MELLFLCINFHFFSPVTFNGTKKGGIEQFANLNVILWIPVRVKNDNGVGSRQVDSETTSTSAQKKHKPIGVWFAKPINSLLSQVATNASVYSLIQIAENMQARICYLLQKIKRDLTPLKR